MLKRIAGWWPGDEQPILRYELGKTRSHSKWDQFVRVLGPGLLLVGLSVLGGDALITVLHSTNLWLSEVMAGALFAPVALIQIFVWVRALVLVAGASEENHRPAWESLRLTSNGMALTLRARWSAVFYRLRWLIGLLMLVRLVLVVCIIYDAIRLRGDLSYLLNGIVPALPLWAGLILLSCEIVASFLLPLTGIGLNAAVGLLVSAVFRQRFYAVIVQIALVAAEVLLAVGLTDAMSDWFYGSTSSLLLWSPLHTGWLVPAAVPAPGSWGLALLNLRFSGEVWAALDYGVFAGIALLLFAWVQALLADWIVALAVRYAEENG